MLIYLKLSGEIDWGWVYVLAPIATVVSLWLTLQVIKETLITINNWMIGGDDEQQRKTDERDELQRSDKEAEERRGDGEADE
tara:strand:- start:382 stop:627 length:246 start_codon:yes stop_codon:yes gene_type:complete